MATPSRRKLLLANVSLGNGGLERQLLLLGRTMMEAWDVRLWTLEAGPYAEPVRAAGINWRCRPRRWRYDPTPALDLWRLMGSWRPDVVHAWHWMPAAAAVPACRALGVPLVEGSIRMGAVPRSRTWPRRCIMAAADIVVANSQAGLDAFHIGPHKGRVIYNAFDEERLSAGATNRGDPGRFTAVMAARMAEQKDFRTVIAAARRLEDATPGAWRFLLVGDGDEREAFIAYADDLVGRGVVDFRTAGVEAIDSIREAQVGLLMTAGDVWAEGCSNSILEYMACGMPVICSDTGGSPELVRDGREGFVIDAYDVAGLASRLGDLRAAPDLCARMGAAGRARIEKEFTVERMVAHYAQAYEDALARRRRSLWPWIDGTDAA